MIETNDNVRLKELRLRYSAISECLTRVEAMQRCFSRNEENREGKTGCEEAFEHERQLAESLRAFLREIRAQERELMTSMYGLDGFKETRP